MKAGNNIFIKSMFFAVMLGFVLNMTLSSCKEKDIKTSKGVDVMKIEITSPAFKEGEMIPAKYTCDGENVSPPLEWGVCPEGTSVVFRKSLDI